MNCPTLGEAFAPESARFQTSKQQNTEKTYGIKSKHTNSNMTRIQGLPLEGYKNYRKCMPVHTRLSGTE